MPLRDFMTESVAQPLFLLQGAILLFLAVACVNVATLVVARRQREPNYDFRFRDTASPRKTSIA